MGVAWGSGDSYIEVGEGLGTHMRMDGTCVATTGLDTITKKQGRRENSTRETAPAYERHEADDLELEFLWNRSISV